MHFGVMHYEGYDLSPIHVDMDGTVYITGEAEVSQDLDRIQAASEALQ